MKDFIKQKVTPNSMAYLSLLVIIYSLAFSNQVVAKDNSTAYSLSIEPQQCVAMRQGQLCYVDVKIAWRAGQTGSYCLFSSLHQEALQCWSNAVIGTFQQEMSAQENIVFSVKRQGSSISLISKELKMAWVYDKSTRKNISWRMF